jgi:hypothetical protein
VIDAPPRIDRNFPLLEIWAGGVAADEHNIRCVFNYYSSLALVAFLLFFADKPPISPLTVTEFPYVPIRHRIFPTVIVDPVPADPVQRDYAFQCSGG